MENDLLGAVAVVIAGVLAYLGVRYTANQSHKAREVSVQAERDAVDAAAYERARESYEAAIARYLLEISRYQAQIEAVQKQLNEKYEENEQLMRARREQRYEIDATVEELISARREFDAHLRECERRVMRLRAKLQEHSLSEEDPDLIG